ncbi:regulatory protein, FmdB family [Thermodesulfobacterium geofontis OPF15]|uniref:Regulatory protein, FmdB family n=1 Tax=Thermodesulfobacterium geofontis (strain OPF15) TaxID=795359 RepID=F8C3C6_THEGP|nr:zinc ribbon domain-containing protein [Thermodesulfobacterium geofontis]AEH23553.1 regulatory protein, FmdB family [Thermodesulfobacterium geofontis OPF15]
MPIYEYECKSCGKHFEVWQKITDEPLKVCKECGGELIKLISESSFILKGTGWYVTDYARKEKEKKRKRKKNKKKKILL